MINGSEMYNQDCRSGRPWYGGPVFGDMSHKRTEYAERLAHAYCDVANLFGSPEAVRRWNNFHRVMTEDHGLSERVALEGMSRGGLIVYNWAKQNPDRTLCIYADAPVLDFKSWPAGQGKGKGSRKTWETCLKAYGLTEKEAARFKGLPPMDCKVWPMPGSSSGRQGSGGSGSKTRPYGESLSRTGSIEVIRGRVYHPHLEDPEPLSPFSSGLGEVPP